MKRKLFVALAIVITTVVTVTTAPMPVKAKETEPLTVYVEDPAGNISVFDSIPEVTLNGNYHFEVCKGIVLDDEGNGTITYDSDGFGGYISYRGITSEPGDEITSLFIIKVNASGYWEDDIQWRIDLTETPWDRSEID